MSQYQIAQINVARMRALSRHPRFPAAATGASLPSQPLRVGYCQVTVPPAVLSDAR